MADPLGSNVRTGLPQLPETLPEKFKDLFQQFMTVYNGIHNLAQQVAAFTGADQQPSAFWPQISLDSTILFGNLGRWYVKQNEAVAFGEVVSPIFTAGEVQIRKANATNNTRWACGVVISTNHVSAIGSFCEVLVGVGIVSGISGLTPAGRYWLSTTNGIVANAPAVAAGNIEQFIGWALDDDRLLINISGEFIQH